MSKYNDVPYKSSAFWFTHPRYLEHYAQLWGFQAKPADNCRVLDVGCASGGNIIPMAAYLPNSSFVGVDLADKQIAAGQQVLDELALKNIELKAMSILDLPEDTEPFDYIIAHGFIAWVPEDVRHATLSLLRRLLSPQGLLLVSYNTLPGWSVPRMVAEISRRETSTLKAPEQKREHSLAVLNMMCESLGRVKHPIVPLIQSQMQTIQEKDLSYFYHDHLSSENRPYYFRDFVEFAASKELQYFVDVDFTSYDFHYHVTPEQRAFYKSLPNLEMQEQYRDYMSMNPFRISLLVRDDVTLKRQINESVIYQSAIISNVRIQSEIEINGPSDVIDDHPLIMQGQVSFTEQNHIGALALLLMSHDHRDQPITFDGLIKKLDQSLQTDSAETIEKVLKDNVMRYLMSGYWTIQSPVIPATQPAAEKPEVHAYTRMLAAASTELCNVLHRPIEVTAFTQFLVQRMDGSRSPDELVDEVIEAYQAGDLAFDFGPVKPNPKSLPAIFKQHVLTCLKGLSEDQLFYLP